MAIEQNPQGHPHLSPEINKQLEQLGEPGATLSLENVNVGQVVTIKFDEGETEWSIALKITQKAQRKPEVKAEGIIVGGKFLPEDLEQFRKAGFPESLVGVECTLLGGCNYNPGAQYGMSMLHMHYIDRGRHLGYATHLNEEESVIWVTPDTVTNWEVSD